MDVAGPAGHANQARELLRRGRAPRRVQRDLDRIDKPEGNPPFSQWEAHTAPGTGSPALQANGVWKHSSGERLGRATIEWLRSFEWRI